MLYTRSSFINYLITVHDCKIININDRKDKVITIKNGPAQAFIWASGKDQIDYEMIIRVCNKLWLTSIPGDKDLEKIE